QRNEPANVRYTAEKLAEIKGVSVGEIIRITAENGKRFFGIK
ncbi:MAG: TatD family hydrolase, partial [Christensenella sp.]